MKSIKLYLLSVLITSSTLGQNVWIDERDSTSYEVVQIGDQLWFQENLKFVTPSSWCAENPDSPACEHGNYYYPTDIINACPTGWKAPTWEDYKKAIVFIQEHYDQDIESENGKMSLYKGFSLDFENIKGIELLNDTAFFNMIATGWIQGDKWESQNQTTMWIIDDFSNTPQPHVHISNERILMHSHKHNVMDKPKKVRRFSIRCTKCAEE